MANIVLIYGSTEGQTRKIADQIAGVARRDGHRMTIVDGSRLPDDFQLNIFDAAIIGASIHAGKYPNYIVQFVKDHRDYLTHTPSAFYTVCLSAASPTLESQARAQDYVKQFTTETGWEPAKHAVFGGALRYSRYNPLKRLTMKFIAWRSGQDTNTAHDWEYTDWATVTHFAEDYFGAVDWAITPFAAA